jgi:hypothetical protein
MGLRTPRQHRVLLGFIVILLILSFLPAIAAALETTTFSIDDSVQGVGPNQFNYIGTGWRHCMVNCGNSFYNKTISWTTTLNDSVTLLFSGTQ